MLLPPDTLEQVERGLTLHPVLILSFRRRQDVSVDFCHLGFLKQILFKVWHPRCACRMHDDEI